MYILRPLWRLLRLAEHLLTGAAASSLPLGARGQRGRLTPPRLVRWWHRRLCRILNVHLHVQGEAPKGPCLVVSNHVSWLDIPVLGSCMEADFVAKSEVRGWPVVGWLAARAGTLFIRRGAHQSQSLVQQISDRLQAGRSVQLFPEGTTTDGRSVRRFFPRLLAPALETQTVLAPIALHYVCSSGDPDVAPFIDEKPFLAHLWRLLKEPRIDAYLCFRAPILPEGRTRSSLASEAHGAVAQTLEELRARSRPAAGSPGGPETDFCISLDRRLVGHSAARPQKVGNTRK